MRGIAAIKNLDRVYGCWEVSGNGGERGLAAKVLGDHGILLNVLAVRDLIWEHVAVWLLSRAPSDEEMALVKQIFFGFEEGVRSETPAGVNQREETNVRHLWKARRTGEQKSEIEIQETRW